MTHAVPTAVFAAAVVAAAHSVSKNPSWADPVWSPATDDELMQQTLDQYGGIEPGDPAFERVMFGSDQMVWPGAVEKAIVVIEEAPFLSAELKRDIPYNNAARFLRLEGAK